MVWLNTLLTAVSVCMYTEYIHDIQTNTMRREAPSSIYAKVPVIFHNLRNMVIGRGGLHFCTGTWQDPVSVSQVQNGPCLHCTKRS